MVSEIVVPVGGETRRIGWTKTHPAPCAELSCCPPTIAVPASADSAAEKPWKAFPIAPVPTSLLSNWVHTPPLRLKTHAAPAPALSPRPPTTAVLPSPDSATAAPWLAVPTAPVPISLAPCWVHTPPLRMKTHAAPTFELSVSPPTMAVLPSVDSATDRPCPERPTAPLPTSLLPCWVHTPP